MVNLDKLVNTDGRTVLHVGKSFVLPLVNGRMRKAVRRTSGGAATERIRTLTVALTAACVRTTRAGTRNTAGKAGAPSRTVPRALTLRMILGCGHRTLAEPQR